MARPRSKKSRQRFTGRQSDRILILMNIGDRKALPIMSMTVGHLRSLAKMRGLPDPLGTWKDEPPALIIDLRVFDGDGA